MCPTSENVPDTYPSAVAEWLLKSEQHIVNLHLQYMMRSLILSTIDHSRVCCKLWWPIVCTHICLQKWLVENSAMPSPKNSLNTVLKVKNISRKACSQTPLSYSCILHSSSQKCSVTVLCSGIICGLAMPLLIISQQNQFKRHTCSTRSCVHTQDKHTLQWLSVKWHSNCHTHINLSNILIFSIWLLQKSNHHTWKVNC